jgi:hypothetical protein
MRGWISLAALFLAVAGLGVWLYYTPRAHENETHALSELKPAQVTRIRIERRHAPESSRSETAATQALQTSPAGAIELEKGVDGWRLTAPFAARADAVQVDRLLSILDSRSNARYTAADLARYGLDEPPVEITLADQSFGFGAVNAITREQYVLTRGAVYAIALAQRPALPRDANALISRSLFASGESPVRFELPQFTAALADGSWCFMPASADLEADVRNAWVDAWRQATALSAARHDDSAPQANVLVRFKDGRTIALGILQLEPDLVLLRPDEGVQYHFLNETGKKLLSLPVER